MTLKILKCGTAQLISFQRRSGRPIGKAAQRAADAEPCRFQGLLRKAGTARARPPTVAGLQVDSM